MGGVPAQIQTSHLRIISQNPLHLSQLARLNHMLKRFYCSMSARVLLISDRLKQFETSPTSRV
jgi:hypothetical protein